MSQIGYMFLGAGIGTYANGEFHLMTHAFFKALLFLAAGVIIHAASDEQDIRKLRGIGASLPWTKWAFLIGSLALVGIPPFAGFFSKDPIIAAALHAHWYGVILAVVALIGAFLTGLYTFRLYFIVFGPGEARTDHPGEGPWTMLLPVGVLSVLALVGGWIQFAPFWTPVTRWLAPVAPTLAVAEPTDWQDAVASILAVALGLTGIAVAYLMYARRTVAVPSRRKLQRVLEHKFYFDEAYDALFFRPAAGLARFLRDAFEGPWFISTPTELGEDTLTVARGVRRIQTGLLRTYVLFLGTGMAVLAVVLLVVK
jgi:NADH-quinone oxidoreductase subunit L